MVRFTVLASGSKGNCSLLSTGSTRILVDAGLSCRELFRRMRQVDEDPASLDAIVITHEHTDHIQGMATTARRLGIPVYLSEGTHREWVRQITPHKRITYAEWLADYRERQSRKPDSAAPEDAGREAADLPISLEAGAEPVPPDCGEPEAGEGPVATKDAQAAKADPAALPDVRYFRPGESFRIGNIDVSPFTIPHDAADPVGFVFGSAGVRVAVATDLGYVPPNVAAQLQRCDLLMIESNHDLEMLRDGPYPWSVKQRVLSRVGHLSNDAAADFLEQTYDGSATWVILAHLSESNNLPELARISAERALAGKPGLLGNRLLLAAQDQPLDPIAF